MKLPQNETKYLRRIPLEKLDEYIKNTLCVMPWNGFNGQISDRINESMNYFYWLFGESLECLQDKQLYRSEPQYLPEISNFLSEYVKEYGKFMDSEKSWSQEYTDIIKGDERFRLEDYCDTEYKTFNDFFIRRPKPEKRISYAGFTAPVDGVVLNVMEIKNGKVEVKIKSSSYHETGRLLLNNSYQNGSLIDIFLDVFDCHRIYAPIDMEILNIRKIDGGNYVGGYVEYVDGKYLLDSSEYGWQSIETRIVIEAYNQNIGSFCMVPVGMSHVGSIEVSCKQGDTVKKGDEIGLFKFGGSCVIIVLKNKIANVEKKHYLIGETLFDIT